MARATYTVLADYEVIDPHPLKLKEGDRVAILKTDASWPGWVWVRGGEQLGWIPRSYLGIETGDSVAVVKGFDGTDLSAKRGDTLEALETVSGWIRGRSADGREGWFPLFNLKPAAG